MPHPEQRTSQSDNPANVSESNETEAFDRILSAREAALMLGVNPRTAQLRARRALTRGDQWVRWIAGAYCAPLWWWKDLLAGPIEPGRPRAH
jgi:hypothetical protein